MLSRAPWGNIRFNKKPAKRRGYSPKVRPFRRTFSRWRLPWIPWAFPCSFVVVELSLRNMTNNELIYVWNPRSNFLQIHFGV